jgi:hypothetical protein
MTSLVKLFVHVTIGNACFNIKKPLILSTRCIYVFHLILILKGDYSSKQNYSFRFCNGDAVFIVRLELNLRTLLNTNFNLKRVNVPNTNRHFYTSFFFSVSLGCFICPRQNLHTEGRGRKWRLGWMTVIQNAHKNSQDTSQTVPNNRAVTRFGLWIWIWRYECNYIYTCLLTTLTIPRIHNNYTNRFLSRSE